MTPRRQTFLSFFFALALSSSSTVLAGRAQEMCGTVARFRVKFIDGTERWVKPAFNDLPEINYDVQVVSIEVIVAGKRRQIHTDKKTRFQSGRDPVDWANVLDKRVLDRTAPVRIRVGSNRIARTVILEESVLVGVLSDARSKQVVIRGFRRVPFRGLEIGSFEHIFAPLDFVKEVSQSKPTTLQTTALTSYYFDLDRIDSRTAARYRNRYVEVTTDCGGNARHVDIFDLDRRFYFSGVPAPVVYGKAPRGIGVKGKVPFAFVDSFGKDGKPRRLLHVSPHVKAYSSEKAPFNWFKSKTLEGGVIAVRIDPVSRLVSHIFVSTSEE